MGSCWGVELVALEASAAVLGNVVPTVAVAVGGLATQRP